MFEAERERCYAGIRKCNEFLKDHVAFAESYSTCQTADEALPEQALNCFYGRSGVGAVIFHLQAKMHFIRLLVDFQEAENALHVD